MTQVHPSAVVDPAAGIGENVDIGPYCVVGPNVTVGDGTRLMSHVVVDGGTTIGKDCVIFPFACLGTQTQDLKFKGAETFVEIGDKTTLREYVTVNSGTNEGEITRVGSGCHIMAYCHVAHACRVGNGVIMANCATLAGEVEVEDGAIIGGLSGVHQFCRIGSMCMVGGCTKITQDCPPYMMIDGNPATVRGLNIIGLKRRDVSLAAVGLLKDAHRLLYRQELSTSQALEQIESTVESCPEVAHLLAFVSQSKRGIIR